MISLILAVVLMPAAIADAPKFEGPKLEGRHQLLHPIVLVHGATTKGSRLQIGMFDFGDYFRGIKAFYEATGTPVYVVELSTDGSIGERAAVLKNFLDSDLKGKMVNLVAHSLGGLDARYVVSVLKSTQVASVTTIGTPHHGSPVADWAIRQSKRGSPWYWFFRLLGYDMDLRRFLPEITTDSMEKVFNPRVPDRADVRYFSVISSGSFRENSMSYILWFPARWLEGEKHLLSAHGHDGLVPKDSQKWGKVIADVTLDHLGQMNHHELRSHSQQETALQVYRVIYDTLLSHGL
jgi:triacylglycerol lipase